MSNLSKLKRDQMINFVEKLKLMHSDDDSILALNEIENSLLEKKFGLVFEEHTEEVDELLKCNIPVLSADDSRTYSNDENLPWNFIIEGDNLQALYLLEKTHRGKIDCIYIDPPYNTGAKDWKYNNDYVDKDDAYRHSKWLSMMKSRLVVAKRLLNPRDSVLICTIDEKEFLHLGCLIEELFPNSKMQMISTVINVKGVARESEFSRVNEYIFIVQLGCCAVNYVNLSDEWLGNVKSSGRNKVRLGSMLRSGSNSERKHSPGCFYPIYFTKDGKYVKTGDPIGVGVDRNSVECDENLVAIWPIHADGTEGVWQYSKVSFEELLAEGFVYFGKLKNGKIGISYAPKGVRNKIAEGKFKIIGYDEQGAAIIDDSNYVASFIPGNQWAIPSHNSTEYGSKLIKEIFLNKRFTYPKSLYAVYDVLRFFIKDKKNAIVLDFFAGSGTTQHAINLLNSEDDGTRHCIMVTNNEVSEIESNALSAQGFKKGDKEWEELGIAKNVTWPRTICSIEGKDIEGHPLKGEYGLKNETYEELDETIVSAESGKIINVPLYKKMQKQMYPQFNNLRKADGFKCNVKYYRCEWIPREPEDYLLSDVLLLHIRSMIELENAINIDDKKYILILTHNDYNKYILKNDAKNLIRRIWVNQNIIFDINELKELKKYSCTFIPRGYFSQELKEVAE